MLFIIFALVETVVVLHFCGWYINALSFGDSWTSRNYISPRNSQPRNSRTFSPNSRDAPLSFSPDLSFKPVAAGVLYHLAGNGIASAEAQVRVLRNFPRPISKLLRNASVLRKAY